MSRNIYLVDLHHRETERKARRLYIPKEIIPSFPIGMQLPEAVYNILARSSNAKSEAGQERLEAERGREGGAEW